jgi:hypothetical protein
MVRALSSPDDTSVSVMKPSDGRESVLPYLNYGLNIWRQGIGIRSMVTEAEYQQALAEIRRLVEDEPDRTSPEGQRLDILAALAETYEAPQSALSLLDINSR